MKHMEEIEEYKTNHSQTKHSHTYRTTVSIKFFLHSTYRIKKMGKDKYETKDNLQLTINCRLIFRKRSMILLLHL